MILQKQFTKRILFDFYLFIYIISHHERYVTKNLFQLAIINRFRMIKDLTACSYTV